VPTCIQVSSRVFKILGSQIDNRQMDGQPENIMPPLAIVSA